MEWEQQSEKSGLVVVLSLCMATGCVGAGFLFYNCSQRLEFTRKERSFQPAK
jgi:hypothetical protein